jgi:hypothetical protein
LAMRRANPGVVNLGGYLAVGGIVRTYREQPRGPPQARLQEGLGPGGVSGQHHGSQPLTLRSEVGPRGFINDHNPVNWRRSVLVAQPLDQRQALPAQPADDGVPLKPSQKMVGGFLPQQTSRIIDEANEAVTGANHPATSRGHGTGLAK